MNHPHPFHFFIFFVISIIFISGLIPAFSHAETANPVQTRNADYNKYIDVNVEPYNPTRGGIALGGIKTQCYYGIFTAEESYSTVYLVIDVSTVHTDPSSWWGGWSVWMSKLDFGQGGGTELGYHTSGSNAADNLIFAVAKNLLQGQSYYVLVSELPNAGKWLGATNMYWYFDAGSLEDYQKISSPVSDAYTPDVTNGQVSLTPGDEVDFVYFSQNYIHNDFPDCSQNSYHVKWVLHASPNLGTVEIHIPDWYRTWAGNWAQHAYVFKFFRTYDGNNVALNYKFYASNGSYMTYSIGVKGYDYPVYDTLILYYHPSSTNPYISELIYEVTYTSATGAVATTKIFDSSPVGWGHDWYDGYWWDYTPWPATSWSGSDHLTKITGYHIPSASEYDPILYHVGIETISTQSVPNFQSFTLPNYNNSAGANQFRVDYNNKAHYNTVQFSFDYQKIYLPVLSYKLSFYNYNSSDGDYTFIQNVTEYNNVKKLQQTYYLTDSLKNYTNLYIKITILSLYIGASITSTNDTIMWYIMNQSFVSTNNKYFRVNTVNINMNYYIYYKVQLSPKGLGQEENYLLTNINYSFRCTEINFVSDITNYTFYAYYSINQGNFMNIKMLHYSNLTNLRDISFHLNISSDWAGSQLTVIVFATTLAQFDLEQLIQLPEFTHNYFIFKNGALPFAQINLKIVNNNNYDDVKITISNYNNNTVIGSDEETEKSYLYTQFINISSTKKIDIKVTVNGQVWWEKVIVLKGNYYQFLIDLKKSPETTGISAVTIEASLYIGSAIGVSFLIMHYSTISFMDTFPAIALGLGIPFFMFGAIPLWVLLLIGIVAGLYYFYARGHI